jgi:hypothetical protein
MKEPSAGATLTAVHASLETLIGVLHAHLPGAGPDSAALAWAAAYAADARDAVVAASSLSPGPAPAEPSGPGLPILAGTDAIAFLGTEAATLAGRLLALAGAATGESAAPLAAAAESLAVVRSCLAEP